MISGRLQDVSPQVQAAIALYGQDLIGQVLPVLQQTRRFVVLTGGGTILLHELLAERLAPPARSQGKTTR